MSNKLFWLKLAPGFFTQKSIKKLRSIAGGDTYTIIYQKMLLKSLETEGALHYEGFEDTFEKELSLDIDEKLVNVEMTVSFLLQHKLLMESGENEYSLPETFVMAGKESSSADRVRKFRQRKKLNFLPKNENCNDSCNVTCNTELEKELEKELELELELESDKEKDIPPEPVKTHFRGIKTDYLTTIHNHWLKQPSLIQSKWGTFMSRIKAGVREQLLRYQDNPGDLQKSIDNYSRVLNSSDHYWSKKWTIWDFLSRGVENFLDESDPWEAYRRSSGSGRGSGSNRGETDQEAAMRRKLEAREKGGRDG